MDIHQLLRQYIMYEESIKTNARIESNFGPACLMAIAGSPSDQGALPTSSWCMMRWGIYTHACIKRERTPDIT